MNRYEFVNQLRRSIAEINDVQFVNETIDYYDRYIDTELAKGISEEEILETLGDPRLIAKSIIASRTVESDRDESVTSTDRSEKVQKATFSLINWFLGLPPVVRKITGAVVAVIVVILLFEIAKVMLPVLILGGLVYYVFRIFIDIRR